jgi:hypothetical protein
MASGDIRGRNLTSCDLTPHDDSWNQSNAGRKCGNEEKEAHLFELRKTEIEMRRSIAAGLGVSRGLEDGSRLPALQASHP